MPSSFSTVATVLFSIFVLVTAYQSPYRPMPADCPSTPLVRYAPPSDPLGGDGICQAELNYIIHRYQNAQTSLANWLQSIDATFCNSNSSIPVLALTTSGGGYRSLLTGAGIIQGFDLRENLTGVSGIFQSLTYHAGLSGGAWLLSALGGNNYPTISYLRDYLWVDAFRGSLLKPFFDPGSGTFRHMQTDVRSKNRAGFHVTLTDSWARILSQKLLLKPNDKNTLSGITGSSSFINFEVPYPIITALGVDKGNFPNPNGPQYEFHPFEFGSWDSGVNAFMQTAYLGSSLSNGQPSNNPESCVTNFDNIGFILGRLLSFS
jgi:lysophospholipase